MRIYIALVGRGGSLGGGRVEEQKRKGGRIMGEQVSE